MTDEAVLVKVHFLEIRTNYSADNEIVKLKSKYSEFKFLHGA